MQAPHVVLSRAEYDGLMARMDELRSHHGSARPSRADSARSGSRRSNVEAWRIEDEDRARRRRQEDELIAEHRRRNTRTASPRLSPIHMVDGRRSHRYTLKPADFPKFDATSSTTVDDWIATITTILDQTGVADFEVTSRLPLVLTGAVSKWFASLSSDERHRLRTWSQWCERLRTAFRPADYDLLLRDRARSRVLLNAESMSDYFYDKIRLLLQCNIDASWPIDRLHRILVEHAILLPRGYQNGITPAFNTTRNPQVTTVSVPKPTLSSDAFPPPAPRLPPNGTPKPPARTPPRPCRHCNGPHWDRDCTNPKKDTYSPATNINAVPVGNKREAFFTDTIADAAISASEPSVNAATPNQQYKHTPCYMTVKANNSNQHRAIVDPGSGISMIAKEYASFHFPKSPQQSCSSFPVRGTFPLSYLAPATRTPFSPEHAQAICTRESFNVAVMDDVTIRPGHRAMVAMKTSELVINYPFLITPISMHGNPDLPCRSPHAIADTSSFMGELVNLHHQPVHLRPGDAIGTATPLQVVSTATYVAENAGPTTTPCTDVLDINPDLSTEQRLVVDTMLRDRMHAFSTNNSVGYTNVAEFRVDTGDHLPISQPPYHASPRQRAAIDESIDTLLAAGHALPSHSPWASPVLVVHQHNKTRMCVDYRKLNKVTKSDQYPLPRIDDILSQFQGKTWFSTLDANRGYHQVPVADGDMKKLAFCTHRGLFEPTVMPFGAKGAPATFQRMMDIILAAGKWQWCLAYLDDVIIYSKTFKEHVNNVAWTLDAIADAGLTLGASKSHLCYQSLDCLGHTVSTLGIGIIGRNIEAILKQDPPKTLGALERFNGLAGHYRRFIERFSLVARPIHEKINVSRKTKVYVLDDVTLDAFNKIKTLVAERPLLAHPDYSLGFRVESDACRDGFGAILSQKGADGIVRPIAFLSRVTTAPEKNYSATELECMALTWALRRFHPYIDGAELEAITDHAALQWLLDYVGPNQRLVCQSLALQPYRDRLTIRHRPGKNHHAHVDQLSRAPLPITEADLAIAEADEPTAATFLTWAAPNDPSLLQEDGFVFIHQPSLGAYALCIPESCTELRDRILFDYHDTPVAGHRNADKTFLAITPYYHWPGMRRNITRSVHASSHVTPFELDLGFHPRFLNHPASISSSHDDADASVFLNTLNAATVDAVESLQYAQARQANQYDARNINRRASAYKIGDQVLLRSSIFKPVFYQKSKSKKLAPTWFGPFTVTAVDSPSVITIDLPFNQNIHNRINTMNARKYLTRVQAHPSAVREVEQILGHCASIRTNAYPNGKPQWLVRFKNAPTGVEQWLDEAELAYYGGNTITNPDNVSSDEDALNSAGGAPAALSPHTTSTV
ncbi:hypothetical protein CspHIS471_0602560 [Cutaneotrichosporon sp. HIS471]|nr:hypothetical protein CspHIS471_0602560 [Cutaneotrichosporon sp. HIS471]